VSERLAICPKCGRRVKRNLVRIEASGAGYSLGVSGIPVFYCHKCDPSYLIPESGGPGLQDIITGVLTALESVSPRRMGGPGYPSLHCRKCGTRLPDATDRVKGHFRERAAIGPGSELIGVDYLGGAITCPRCGLKHPHLPATLYHQIRDSLTTAAQFYVRT
jgi:hypothetical protein